MSKENWKDIAAKIAAQIESGELAPGARLPSGDQLALDLGVDRNAAHRAVDYLQRQGLVVRRRGSGTVVADRRQPTRRIALLVDGYSAYHNFPSGDLLRGIHDRLGEDSVLVIADSKHDPAQEARQLRRLAHETDGILLYATALEKPTALMNLIESDFPVVALDRLPKGVEMDAAMTDNFESARMAVRNLIERGHREVAFISLHKPDFSSVMARYEGFLAALKEAGIPSENLVRWIPEGLDLPSAVFGQIVQDSMQALRQRENPVTAVFCVEDRVGCAVVAACEQLGIRLPHNLEIATFNDWHPMTLRTPWNIHRVIQRKYELGYTAAGLLLDRIAEPGQPARTMLVPADLILADAGLEESFVSPTPTAIRYPEGLMP